MLFVVGANAALFFVLLVARVAVGGYAVDEAAPGLCDARGAFAVLMPTIVGLEIGVPHDPPPSRRPAARRPPVLLRPPEAAVVRSRTRRSAALQRQPLWLAASTAALLLLFILPAMLIDATDPSSAAVRGGWLLAAASSGLHATHYCLLRHLFLPAGRVLAAKADAAGRPASPAVPAPSPPSLPSAAQDQAAPPARRLGRLHVRALALLAAAVVGGARQGPATAARLASHLARPRRHRPQPRGGRRDRPPAEGGGAAARASAHRRGVEEARELQLAQMRLRDAGHRDAAGGARARRRRARGRRRRVVRRRRRPRSDHVEAARPPGELQTPGTPTCDEASADAPPPPPPDDEEEEPPRAAPTPPQLAGARRGTARRPRRRRQPQLFERARAAASSRPRPSSAGRATTASITDSPRLSRLLSFRGAGDGDGEPVAVMRREASRRRGAARAIRSLTPSPRSNARARRCMGAARPVRAAGPSPGAPLGARGPRASVVDGVVAESEDH